MKIVLVTCCGCCSLSIRVIIKTKWDELSFFLQRILPLTRLLFRKLYFCQRGPAKNPISQHQEISDELESSQVLGSGKLKNCDPPVMLVFQNCQIWICLWRNLWRQQKTLYFHQNWPNVFRVYIGLILDTVILLQDFLCRCSFDSQYSYFAVKTCCFSSTCVTVASYFHPKTFPIVIFFVPVAVSKNIQGFMSGYMSTS